MVLRVKHHESIFEKPARLVADNFIGLMVGLFE